MAYVKFKQKDEVSTKSHYVTGQRKLHRFRRIWKYGFLLSFSLNLYLIYHFNLYKIILEKINLLKIKI